MNIGQLERAAGVTDRKAFWERFAHQPHGFAAGRDELHRLAGMPVPHDVLSQAAGIPAPSQKRKTKGPA